MRENTEISLKMDVNISLGLLSEQTCNLSGVLNGSYVAVVSTELN